ncbi:glycosyl transferase family 2 [Roseibium sp. TrichSKD4]|nr:glycosyl transferase family 2 [Roseibium sp. TrichSKD4]
MVYGLQHSTPWPFPTPSFAGKTYDSKRYLAHRNRPPALWCMGIPKRKYNQRKCIGV